MPLPALRSQLSTKQFATHHFELNDIEQAYETFGDAGATGALKVVISR